jgi:hypothetical protein
LFDAKVNQHSRLERKYEIAFCNDCQRMINFYQADPMTGEQIVQLFKDIKAGVVAIDGAKDDLSSCIDETLQAFRNL